MLTTSRMTMNQWGCVVSECERERGMLIIVRGTMQSIIALPIFVTRTVLLVTLQRSDQFLDER